MKITLFRRVVAAVLCLQPPFWMSSVALAQTLQPQPLQPQTQTLQPNRAQPPGAPSPLTPLAAPRTEPDLARAVVPELPAGALPPLDEPVDPDEYVCGPGDVLELNFWGVQEFKQRVTVDVEGRAFVSRIGYLKLQGKTLSEARRTMREVVARQWRLDFDVGLAQPRTFVVQVVDGVARPAAYPARAVERVATLVERAGGLALGASKRRIEIRRRTGEVLHADLLRYETTGDVKYNPHLLDGDVVRVPFEDLAAEITGAVNRPGRYELTEGRDLAELVELAGGLAPTATRLLPVSLVRRLSDDRQEQQMLVFPPDGGLPRSAIEHEDRVTIPSFTDLQQSVMVIGAIFGAVPASGNTPASATIPGASAPEEASATRRLPFVQGDSVRTLLERVGGVGPLADLTGSYVLRNGRSVPVDLYALLMLRDLKADHPIELGDTLVVPFKRRNILVEGAVFKPGPYPYNPAFGIDQYLSLAGGRNRFARSVSDVRVVTPDGETKAYDPALKVEPGSSLVVPERNFSRSEVVQILLSVAGIVLSGATLIITARQ